MGRGACTLALYGHIFTMNTLATLLNCDRLVSNTFVTKPLLLSHTHTHSDEKIKINPTVHFNAI